MHTTFNQAWATGRRRCVYYRVNLLYLGKALMEEEGWWWRRRRRGLICDRKMRIAHTFEPGGEKDEREVLALTCT